MTTGRIYRRRGARRLGAGLERIIEGGAAKVVEFDQTPSL